jgi:hypothetical protein
VAEGPAAVSANSSDSLWALALSVSLAGCAGRGRRRRRPPRPGTGRGHGGLIGRELAEGNPGAVIDGRVAVVIADPTTGWGAGAAVVDAVAATLPDGDGGGRPAPDAPGWPTAHGAAVGSGAAVGQPGRALGAVAGQPLVGGRPRHARLSAAWAAGQPGSRMRWTSSSRPNWIRQALAMGHEGPLNCQQPCWELDRGPVAGVRRSRRLGTAAPGPDVTGRSGPRTAATPRRRP